MYWDVHFCILCVCLCLCVFDVIYLKDINRHTIFIKKAFQAMTVMSKSNASLYLSRPSGLFFISKYCSAVKHVFDAVTMAIYSNILYGMCFGVQIHTDTCILICVRWRFWATSYRHLSVYIMWWKAECCLCSPADVCAAAVWIWTPLVGRMSHRTDFYT